MKCLQRVQSIEFNNITLEPQKNPLKEIILKIYTLKQNTCVLKIKYVEINHNFFISSFSHKSVTNSKSYLDGKSYFVDLFYFNIDIN